MTECHEHPVANPVSNCNACFKREFDAMMARDLLEAV